MSKVQLGHYTGGDEEPTTGAEMAGPPTHKRTWDHHEKEWGPWYPLAGPRNKRGKPLVFPAPIKPHYPPVHTVPPWWLPSHPPPTHPPSPMSDILRWFDKNMEPLFPPPTEDPPTLPPATAISTTGSRRSVQPPNRLPPTVPTGYDNGGWLGTNPSLPWSFTWDKDGMRYSR